MVTSKLFNHWSKLRINSLVSSLRNKLEMSISNETQAMSNSIRLPIYDPWRVTLARPLHVCLP